MSTVSSNATTMEKKKSMLYSRSTIYGLLVITYISYFGLLLKPIEKGIGLFNSLFNVTTQSQSFNVFIILLGSTICILTAYYPKTVLVLWGSYMHKKVIGKIGWILNKTASQFTIIEYALIMIFILCGATFLMSTGDLISLFLSIELQSYGLYILATLYRDSESATGSALTYFLLGGLSSCFILLGSAILYVNSGTTDLDNIYIINSINEFTDFTLNKLIENSKSSVLYWGKMYTSDYINFSLVILMVGFLFKVSAAPFHFWSPDVYDGIPTIVTTFVAIIAKISIFVLMLELVSYITTPDLNVESSYLALLGSEEVTDSKFLAWKSIVVIGSLMSLIVGSVLGLTQYRIKRLFAYSTISHVGFILLALSINSIESIQGYVFYILQYSLSNLNAFFILITIGYTLSSYFNKTNVANSSENEDKFIDAINSPIQLLNQLKGYFHVNSFLSISLAITLFSFVGIPPLIGFFAKQMVLSAALDKGYVFITFIGIITSVIAAAYYLNMIKLLFFNDSIYSIAEYYIYYKKRFEPRNTYICTNNMLTLTITILTMIILLFIYMPDEWFRMVSILSLSYN